MCQCKFMNYDRGSVLTQSTDAEGGSMCVGTKTIWELTVLSVQLHYNSTTSYK